MAAVHGGLVGQPNAGQPAPTVSALTPQAQAVGNQFVTQYYTVLHQQPRFLHRFYTDASTMTYSEPGSTDAVVFNSQKKIHEKVMSLGYQGAVTEIYSVDSQCSLNDGVIVQVTGSLKCTDGPKRNFTQTFFLAVQEKGYFVLNDLFRILPDALAPPQYGAQQPPQANGYAQAAPLHPPPVEHPPQLNGAAPLMPPALAQQLPPSAANVPIPPPQLAPVQPPAPQPAAPSPPPQQPPPQPQPSAPVATAAPAAEPAAATQAEPEAAAEAPIQEEPQAAAAEPAAPQEPAPEPAPEPEPQPEVPAVPLTYAERLKLGAKAAPKPAPRPAPQPKPAADSPSAAAFAGAESNGVDAAAAGGGNNSYLDEAPGCAIFVKDLPADITAERLAQAFAEYGTLAPGNRGVNLKTQKDKPPFAFIEFEQPASAAAAINATVVVDSQTVRVDEKKPLYILRSNRGGRGDYGRGGRGDYGRGSYGGRGRGEYSGRGPIGGRGPGGRGDFGGRGYGGPIDGGRGRGGPLGAARGDAGRAGRGGRGPRDAGRGPRAPTPAGGAPAPAADPQASAAGGAVV